MTFLKNRPCVGSFYRYLIGPIGLFILKKRFNFFPINFLFWNGFFVLSILLPPSLKAEDLSGFNLINLDVLHQKFSDGKFEINIKSDVQSDPLPVKYLGHSSWMKFLEARTGTNLVRVDKSVEIQLTSQDKLFSLGLISRSLGRLLISETTVRSLRVVANQETQSKDWLVDAHMNMQGFSGTGVQWQKKYNISPHLQWSVGGQGLLLTSLSSRDLSGQVGYQQLDQSYRFEIIGQEKNSALRLPYQEIPHKFGQGLLFNSHLVWQSNDVGVELGVKDFGILRWQGMPQRVLKLNTNVTERDSNGYLIYRPLLTGQNYQSSLLMKSPWVAELTPRWSPSKGYYFSTPLQYIPNFGWLKAYRWTDNQGSIPWAIEWREHDRNLVFQGQWNRWVADFGFSNFNSNSRSQVLKVSYVGTF